MSDVGDKLGIHPAKVSAPDRDPVRAIVRFVNDHDNDLMVLATHGREGLPRWLRGSVTEPAAREADTPTLFLPRVARLRRSGERRRAAPHRSDSDRSPAPAHAAVREVARLCRTLSLSDIALRLVYVGEQGDMPALEFDTAMPSEVTREARSGDVVDELRAAAADCQADLIAMATAGHQAFLEALRGSTTKRVLRHAALCRARGAGPLGPPERAG